MQENRKDLSHPVHSDNCILDEAMGECNKVPPAYTWRDYRYSYIVIILIVKVEAFKFILSGVHYQDIIKFYHCSVPSST